MINFKKIDQNPRHTKCSDEADQLEWRTLSEGSSPVDAAQMDDEISGSIEEPQSARESDAFGNGEPSDTVGANIQGNLRSLAAERLQTEKRSEELSAGTLAEIERRSSIMGEHYPFRLKGSALLCAEVATPAHPVYFNCLKTSIKPTPADREAFESLVVSALGAYLGGSAKSQLFGWQAKAEPDQPRRIKAMMTELHSHTGEWPWSPDADLPDDPDTTIVKDLGLDAVAWLPMPDRRWGKVMLLAQCATGRTDWEKKLSDVSWDRIEEWIRPTAQRWGVRCFAIPFHLPNESKWRAVSKRGGLFLDRARLTLLLKGS